MKAVLSYRVVRATNAIINVDDFKRSTQLLAASSLRSVLATKTLAEILSERNAVSTELKVNTFLILVWRDQLYFCRKSVTKQLANGVWKLSALA